MAGKKDRHDRILYLIEQEHISTQEELRQRLLEEGYDVTQTTISRDLRELKLNKLHVKGGKNGYSLRYTHVKSREWNMEEKYLRVLMDGFVSMEAAMNILVIHTVSGMAMAVAAALDSLTIPQVVGTIAGDDTIMMAIKTPQDTKLVMELIGENIRR